MLLRQLLQSGFLSISWPLALQVGGCPPTVLWVLENFCWLANICLPAGSIGLLWVVFSVLRHIVSGSEMIWLDSLSWVFLRAAARCEMNGIYLHVYGLP